MKCCMDGTTKCEIVIAITAIIILQVDCCVFVSHRSCLCRQAIHVKK